jgi:hypothetical protein
MKRPILTLLFFVGFAMRGVAATPTPSGHWAFQPVQDPAPPTVQYPDWCHTSLDRFILARLESNHVPPAPAADRRALIRRASFDLTGLPPSASEIDAFIADTSPDAWKTVVDRLLDSPHYGEHWGRHWLDVVRYADTAGETADYPVPVAWRYRNYVIDAFNTDKPYDQFLREQIAGDILARQGPRERYAEQVTATGYLAISRRFGFDSENYHHLTIQDTIDTVGQSILGLTLGCARCHAHKYDPVSMPEYYGIYGIFESTRYAFPGSEQKQRHRAMVPLLPPEESTPQWQAFELQVASLTQQLERQKKSVPSAVLRSLDELDGDFEMQAPAAGGSKGVLVPPWVYEGPIAVTHDAQSPFKNLHPLGKVGASVASGTNGYRIGQSWHGRRHRDSGRLLHVNLDFRIGTHEPAATGVHRFWIGNRNSGPAVEVLLASDSASVRTGDRLEVIRQLGTNAWHNLQLTLDLQAGTVAGRIGSPGDITDFPARPLAPAASAGVDFFGIDAQAHGSTVLPSIAFDNLGVQQSPIPPVTTQPPAVAPSTEENDLAAISAQLESLLADGPFAMVYGVSEGTPGDARIQVRGEPDRPGAEVPRGFLAALGGGPLPKETEGSGRLELAHWLTTPTNPLTARVMVNRIWQYHFGQGLVKTPNDFGTRGQPPTHPELLDHLATAFIRSGWSIKAMHRLILASATYRQQSRYSAPPTPSTAARFTDECPVEPSPTTAPLPVAVKARSVAAGVPPAVEGGVPPPGSLPGSSPVSNSLKNTEPSPDLVSPFTRRRLAAEEVRDAILRVSGALDPTPGEGHPFPAPTRWGYTQHGPYAATYDHSRRSVYLMTQRIKRHPFLALFDGADPNASTAERRTSTVPTQALFFLNDPFVHAQAETFAQRVLATTSAEPLQIAAAYRLALGRNPTPAEQRDAATFLAEYRAELELAGMDNPLQGAHAAFARVLFGSNEFLTVD